MLRLPFALTALALLLPSAARADTITIPATSDAAANGLALQNALAGGSAEPRTIVLTAGTYSGTSGYNLNNARTVTVRGAGRGLTTITGPGNNIFALVRMDPVGANTATLEDLTVAVPSTGYDFGVSASGDTGLPVTLTRVAVQAATGFVGAGISASGPVTITGSAFTVPGTNTAGALRAQTSVVDSTFSGGVGVRNISNGGGNAITFDRVSITATTTGIVDNNGGGIWDVRSSVVRAPTAISLGAAAGLSMTLTGSTVEGTTAIPSNQNGVTARNTLLLGAITKAAGAGFTQQRSAYDSTQAAAGIAAPTVDLTGLPRSAVVGGDDVPAAGSPILDQGDRNVVNAPGDLDLAGLPRSLAATVNGNATPDIGAFERAVPLPVPAGTLLAGGDAESGTTGWTVATGTPTTGVYGDADRPTALLAGAIAGGTSFFAAGGSPESALTQRVDVSPAAATIDGGNQSVTAAALLGGVAFNDAASVTVTALGASGAALGTTTLGPVAGTERAGFPTLLPRRTTTTLPAGTRSLDVAIRLARAAGSPNGAVADDVALTADPAIPAPSTTPGPAVTPTPTVTPPPPAARTFTGLKLRAPKRVGKRRTLPVRVTCPAAATTRCAGRLTVQGVRGKRRITLGRKRFTVTAGRSRTVRVRLGRKAVRKLGRPKRYALRLTATATDAAGRTGTVRKTARVRRR